MTTRFQARQLAAMERKVTIEEMWAEGATMTEIAAELGTTMPTVKTAMHEMRRSPEWDLPRRKPGAWRQ